jgi:hypothetical protein
MFVMIMSMLLKSMMVGLIQHADKMSAIEPKFYLLMERARNVKMGFGQT